MLRPTPSTTTDTGNMFSSRAPAQNSDWRGPGTLEITRFNGGRVRLLDVPRLRDQLVGLERRTGRGTGRDIIDHRPGGHDDVANAVAGALALAVAKPGLGGLPLMVDGRPSPWRIDRSGPRTPAWGGWRID